MAPISTLWFTAITFALSQLLTIENDLNDLMLLQTIDISIFNHIKNPELIDHIRWLAKYFMNGRLLI